MINIKFFCFFVIVEQLVNFNYVMLLCIRMIIEWVGVVFSCCF